MKLSKRVLKNYCAWYLMLLLPLGGTILFNIYPLIVNFFNSFRNNAGDFIGWVNYGLVFADEEFLAAIINTLYMGVIGVGLSIPIAFVLAYFLQRVTFAKGIFKTIFLLPMIMSMVSVAMIFKHIFSADAHSVANYVLEVLGLEPLGWFAKVGTARETVMIMTLWKGVGFSVILFFAGLQAIPTDLFEAAAIDGADEWNKFWHITIPCMRNTLIFVYITNSIGAINRFAEVYAVGGEYGYPANKLITLMLYVYRKSFSTLFYKDLGMAATASILMFVIIMVITGINWKITGESESLRSPKSIRKLSKRR